MHDGNYIKYRMRCECHDCCIIEEGGVMCMRRAIAEKIERIVQLCR